MSKSGTEELQTVYPEAGRELQVGRELDAARLEPAPGHLLVELLPRDERIGDIVLPQIAQQDKNVAWVRRVGPDVRPYGVGDLVILFHDGGERLDLGGHGSDYRILDARDVLGRWAKKTVDTAKSES